MAESKPKAAKAESGEDRPEPTHDLLLADGSTVEHIGGIPTHIAVGDRAIPVVRVIER